MNDVKQQLDDSIYDLVQKYSDTVLRIAVTYLKNYDDAQDVCQDIFIKLYKLNRTFNNNEHEKAWIIRVTINHCKDILKKPWKRNTILVDEIVLPINDSNCHDVVLAVLSLPIKYRGVIYLYYYENIPTNEISKILKRKESTVRTQLKRAREILKTLIIGGFENDK